MSVCLQISSAAAAAGTIRASSPAASRSGLAYVESTFRMFTRVERRRIRFC